MSYTRTTHRPVSDLPHACERCGAQIRAGEEATLALPDPMPIGSKKLRTPLRAYWEHTSCPVASEDAVELAAEQLPEANEAAFLASCETLVAAGDAAWEHESTSAAEDFVAKLLTAAKGDATTSP